MKAIVTGATGFIGTALCREMIQNGHEVMAVIRPGNTKKEKLQLGESARGGLTVLEMPLGELEDLAAVVSDADVFFHLAWNGSSGGEREDFEAQYANIGYTAAAVRAAKKCGCRKFVGAGSQAEYGVVQETAEEERTPPNPFMMYGAAKLSACHMGRLVAEHEGISFVWPRIYSVYGVGENPGTLVNYVMDTLRKGEIPELSPCENMWNFLYITDCVRALRMLAECENARGVFHVASKDTRLLKEYVTEMRDLIAPGAELGFGAKQANPRRTFWLQPDMTKLEKIGFRAEVSFAEGIRRKINVHEGDGRNTQRGDETNAALHGGEHL